MNTGPPPTRLVFLNELPNVAPGSKVRFLGCVTEYVTSSGTLKLQHAHNATDSKASSAIVALVDIELLLETIKATDMHVGAWVNVIGYVDAGARVSRRVAGTGKDQGIDVKIQAVMLWSAGSIRIGDYEQALQGRRGLD